MDADDPSCGLFLIGSGLKLSGWQEIVDNFARWGYPDWFRIGIGVVELIGALVLLVPRIAIFGATLLGLEMIDAVVTVIKAGEFPKLLVPIVALLLLSLLGYVRRDGLMRMRSGGQFQRTRSG